MSSSLILSTIWQGLLWGILALGVYVTYRVLDIADLTVEGSYPLGAAVAISYIAGGGSPVIAVVLAFSGRFCCRDRNRIVAYKVKDSGIVGGDLNDDWVVFY